VNLILAPLRGHTDFVFRNALARHFSGLDASCSPFITTVKGETVRDSHIRDVLPKYNVGHSVIPQIISKDPEEFTILANQLCSLGYKTINWNLGCPYPMVVNKRRGAGMLPFPELIEEFLSLTIPRVKCTVDVKMRLGRDNPDEATAVLAILNAFPIGCVTIHARTAKQMYEGTVDLDWFERCLAMSTHPVVYNGDITDIPSFDVVSKRFPSLNSFMIGRGVLMNPALPELIKGISGYSGRTYAHRLNRFHEDLIRGYGAWGSVEQTLLGRLKQLWCYLSFSFPNSEDRLRKIQRTKTIKDYRDEVEDAFKELSKTISA